MILFLRTEDIVLYDIPEVLENLGYSIMVGDLTIKVQLFEREKCNEIVGILQQYKPRYVMSYDFVETISQACLETEVPYIAWVFDAPQQELYSRYAHNPNNYIFVFDRMQQKRLRQIGLKNVHHMPLGSYGEQLEHVLEQGEEVAGQYEADVAFVGQLYRRCGFEKFVRDAEPIVQAAMEESIADCFLRWDKDIRMHGTLRNVCVQYFSLIEKHEVGRRHPFMTEQFYYEAAVLSRIIANRERVAILNELAEDYDVRFYTFGKDNSQLSEKVKVCPGISCNNGISHVYQQSKINLNITLHCIETGLSQRVFDVMAAGGFLLTNYQEEIEDYFVPGEDLVVYHNMEELRYYVQYYLEHEEERKRIAENGRKKVLQYHDLHSRMQQVMELVQRKESERKESYEALLKKRKPHMDMMQELIACANTEHKLGQNKLFAEISNMEDAVEKYAEVRNRLLEITSDGAETEYAELCRMIFAKGISLLYIVWLIYMKQEKKEEKETILLRLCNHIEDFGLVKVMELVSYGLMMTPKANRLLLKKAECLMDVCLWQGALDTLKQIEKPGGDITALIKQLEAALGA